MSLSFAPSTHRYKLDGKPVTGVTSILGAVESKPNLMDWQGRMVAEYVDQYPLEVERLRGLPDTEYRGKPRTALVEHLRKVPYAERDKAAARGTAIHDFGEQYITGQEAVTIPEFEAECLGLMDFIDAWEFEPLIVEKSLGNREHWYAGRVDFIGTSPYLNGGEPVLIDWKTSNGVYPTVALQAAAYAKAEFWVTDDDPDAEHPLPDITATYVAHIHHSYVELKPLARDTAEIERHYQIFTHCKQLFDDFKAIKDVIGLPLQAPGATVPAPLAHIK